LFGSGAHCQFGATAAFLRYSLGSAGMSTLPAIERSTTDPQPTDGRKFSEKKETNARFPRQLEICILLQCDRQQYLISCFSRSLRSGPPRAYRHAVQFPTPFIDDTNRTVMVRAGCSGARPPVLERCRLGERHRVLPVRWRGSCRLRLIYVRSRPCPYRSQ
jgi:hypothetical protein